MLTKCFCLCASKLSKREKNEIMKLICKTTFILQTFSINFSHSNIFTNECRIGKRANKGQESTSKYSYTYILVSAEKQEDNQ